MRCDLIWVRNDFDLDRTVLTAAEKDWLDDQAHLFCMVRLVVGWGHAHAAARFDSRDIMRWLKLYATGWDTMSAGNLRFIGFSSEDEAMAFRMRWM